MVQPHDPPLAVRPRKLWAYRIFTLLCFLPANYVGLSFALGVWGPWSTMTALGLAAVLVFDVAATWFWCWELAEISVHGSGITVDAPVTPTREFAWSSIRRVILGHGHSMYLHLGGIRLLNFNRSASTDFRELARVVLEKANEHGIPVTTFGTLGRKSALTQRARSDFEQDVGLIPSLPPATAQSREAGRGSPET